MGAERIKLEMRSLDIASQICIIVCIFLRSDATCSFDDSFSFVTCFELRGNVQKLALWRFYAVVKPRYLCLRFVVTSRLAIKPRDAPFTDFCLKLPVQ